jgi:hypothetical protein
MQEWGYRDAHGNIIWCATRSSAETIAKHYDYALVARDVSEPYVVSIR